MKYFEIAIPIQIFTTMMFNEYKNDDIYAKINHWCSENCKQAIWLRITTWRFELEEDAMAFKLRWL